MPLNQIQQTAQQAGHLVYAIDQSNTPPLTEPGPWGGVHNGYCAGLAIRWIALHYAMLDYRFDPATRLCENPDWQATRDQTVMGQAYSDPTLRFPEHFRQVFGAYGLQLNLGAITGAQTAMSGQAMLRAGQAALGCHLIYMAGNHAGRPVAHAVVMANQGSHGWRFFDANFGHFRFPDAKVFGSFIDWFMRESGYARNGFLSQSHATVHINPPPFTGASFSSVMQILTKKLGR